MRISELVDVSMLNFLQTTSRLKHTEHTAGLDTLGAIQFNAIQLSYIELSWIPLNLFQSLKVP